MATTIQVQRETLSILKRLRADYQAASYDEVLKRMHNELTKGTDVFGMLKGIPKRKILEGIRDKRDRF